MLDNILNIVKDKASDAIFSNSAVPQDKKQQTVETTTRALADGLKQNLHIGNLSQLSGLFGGGNASSANPLMNNIQTTVANELTQKVGLSPVIATTIAATVVSAVMKAISGKVNDPNDKGFNLESLVNTFTGGKSSTTTNNTTTDAEQNSAGSIIGSLGKLFK